MKTKTMTVAIFNAAGQRVKESKGKYENTTIDIGNLPSGVYVVKCTGDKKENFSQKFVK